MFHEIRGMFSAMRLKSEPSTTQRSQPKTTRYMPPSVTDDSPEIRRAQPPPVPKPKQAFWARNLTILNPKQKTTNLRPTPNPGDEEIFIAVMGGTGSGKSYFCRAATGYEDIKVGDKLESCTKQASAHRLMVRTSSGDRLVTLIDTPGFNDSTRNDVTILDEIANELRARGRKFSGILYFHRISDPRMEGSAIKQLKMFRALCGDETNTLKNVIMVTNRWDRLESEALGNQRLKELKEKYWRLLCQKGSRVERFSGTRESALDLIELVTSNIPQQLKIQEELESGMTLSETGAGQVVNAEIEKLRKENEEKLTLIKEEMDRAIMEKDEKMRLLLDEEAKRSREQILELVQQQDILKKKTEGEIRVAMEQARKDRESNEQWRRDKEQEESEHRRRDKERKRCDHRRRDKERKECDHCQLPTDLLTAVQAGDADTTHALLRKGANANSLSPNGFSMLHCTDDEEVARVLLQHGANINLRSGCFGRTPLANACVEGNRELVMLLLTEGAAINIPDNHGLNALHLAVMGYNHYGGGDRGETVRQLMAFNAIPYHYGHTVMPFAGY